MGLPPPAARGYKGQALQVLKKISTLTLSFISSILEL